MNSFSHILPKTMLTTKPYRRAISLMLMMACIALSLMACTPSSNVRLLYQPASTILPPPDAPQVTVIIFANAKSSLEIGTRSDGTSFSSLASVEDWISRNLADELIRHGLQVTYATNPHVAIPAQSFVMRGTVEKVALHETSSFDYSASIILNTKLEHNGQTLFSETLSSSQSVQDLPSSSLAENLMLSTLRAVIVPTAEKINTTIRNK